MADFCVRIANIKPSSQVTRGFRAKRTNEIVPAFNVPTSFPTPVLLSVSVVQMLDTKDLVLKTLMAHLQIRGLAKELTPYYETADVEILDAGRAILDEGDDTNTALPRE